LDPRTKKTERTSGHAIASGLSWVLIQKGSLQGISLITTIILARLLAPSDFGLVALTAIFMQLSQFFIDQGMGAAIVQRKDLRPEHIDSIFWINIGMSLLLLLAGFFLAVPISRIFNEPAFVSVFRVLLLSLPISAVNMVQRSMIQRNMDFRSLTMPTVISVALGAIAGITMALLGMGVWSLVAQNLVTNTATVPLFWKYSKWRPRMCFSVAHSREIFPFSVYVMCTSLLYLVNKKVDQLLIGFFLGTSALGIYAIALRLAATLDGTITQIVGTVFFPILSRKQGNSEAFNDHLHKAFRLVGVIAFPVYIGVSVVAADLLPLLYGQKWIEGVPVMQVMSFFFLYQALLRVNNIAITAAGQPKIILRLHIFSSIAQVIVIYFATKNGLVWVSFAIILRAYTLFPLYLIAMQRTVSFSPKSFLASIYPPLGGVCLMALSVVGLQWILPSLFIDRWISLIITVGIGVVTYMLGVLCVAPQWTWSMARNAVSFAHAR
jgi:O-antigen/teichoic acid export membrane protein